MVCDKGHVDNRGILHFVNTLLLETSILEQIFIDNFIKFFYNDDVQNVITLIENTG